MPPANRDHPGRSTEMRTGMQAPAALRDTRHRCMLMAPLHLSLGILTGLLAGQANGPADQAAFAVGSAAQVAATVLTFVLWPRPSAHLGTVVARELWRLAGTASATIVTWMAFVGVVARCAVAGGDDAVPFWSAGIGMAAIGVAGFALDAWSVARTSAAMSDRE